MNLPEIFANNPKGEQAFKDWFIGQENAGNFLLWKSCGMQTQWGHFLAFFDEQGIQVGLFGGGNVGWDSEINTKETDDIWNKKDYAPMEECQIEALSAAFELLEAKL